MATGTSIPASIKDLRKLVLGKEALETRGGEWKQEWLERREARPISGQIRAGRKQSAEQCIMENTPISVAQACPSQPAPDLLALCPSSASS